MLNIMTSNIGTIRTLAKDNIAYATIVAYPPDYLDCPNLEQLAPDKELFHSWKNREIDDHYYEVEYKKSLLSVDFEETVKTIASLHDHSLRKGFALLCYCKAGSLCHRKWVRDWFAYNNFPIFEYSRESKNKKKLPTLF